MSAFFRSNALLLAGGLLLGFIGGCAGFRTAEQPSAKPLGREEARVSVYFSPRGSCSHDHQLTLQGLELLHNDLWVPMGGSAVDLHSAQRSDRQQLLAVAVLSAGQYAALRFRLSPAGEGGGEWVEINLSPPLTLAEGDSTCLFLEWNREGCLEPTTMGVFAARVQTDQLAGELLYAVCDDIATLYFIRTDRQFVVGSLGLPGVPGDLAFDRRRNRIYLLGGKPQALLILDATTHRLLDSIRLSSLLHPRYLALDPAGTSAWITDAVTDRLVQVDLGRGLVSREVTLGVRPERLLYFEVNGLGRLAVSSPGAQSVLIVEPRTLATLARLPVPVAPAGLAQEEEILYVADEGSHSVTAFDAATFRQVARIGVGLSPIPLENAPGGRIYAGNYHAGTLSVIARGQAVPLREIVIGPTPFDLAFFSRRQLLYVAHRMAKKITCFDPTAETVLAEIPLGGTPFALLSPE